MKKIFIFILLLVGHSIKAQWQPTNGPCNAVITSFEKIGNKIFAGTDNSSIFFSENNGISWLPANNSLFANSTSVNCFLKQGSTLYAGINSLIAQSTDLGNNWTYLEPGFPNPSFHNGALSLYLHGNSIWAGSQSAGMVFSQDHFNTFTSKNTGIPSMAIPVPPYIWYQPIKTIIPYKNELIIGIYGNGIYASSDSGDNWSSRNTGLTNLYVNGITQNASGLFAATNNGVYYSTDSGHIWLYANNGLNDTLIKNIACSGNTLFAGTAHHGIFRSTDNGNNWVPVNNGISDLDIYTISIIDNLLFASTTNGNLFISENLGNDWSLRNGGITRLSIFSLLTDSNKVFAGTGFSSLGNGGGNGVYLSTDFGATWKKTKLGWTEQITSLAIDSDYLFAGTWGTGIYRTNDNGETWMQINNGLSYLEIKCLTSFNNNIYAGTEHGVWRSTDHGNTWNASNNGFGTIWCRIYSIISKDNSLYAGTSLGVFKSDDDGLTWVELNTGINSMFATVYALCTNDTDLFANLYSQVYRFSANDVSWQVVNNGWSVANSINALLAEGNYIVGGTDTEGVYISGNKGDNWYAENTNLTTKRILSLNLNSKYLLAGTETGGLFFMARNSFIDTEELMENPELVWPNPSSNFINVKTSKQGYYKIYNITGRLIDEQQANADVTEIDIHALSNGLYILSVYDEETTKHIKFIKY